MYKFNIVKDSTKLRKLIAENPELPIVVMIGRDAATDEFYWTYSADVCCEVGEILDCECPWAEGKVYNDREEFEEDLIDYLADYNAHRYPNSMSEEGFDKLFEHHKEKYEPYWRKAIIIKADN